MKRIFLSTLCLAAALTAVAGDYITNTNQHVAFLRNPARNATTDIDAIYSNPAGMAFFKEGWQFSFNGQSAYQTRTINSTFLPFADNADGKSSTAGERRFKGTASAPFIPSVYAAYKKGAWTFGGHFALVGGGGKATFNNGLPSFEAPVSLIPTLLTQAATALGNSSLAATKYQYDTYMQGRQYIFGLSMGAAYRISPNWSVYVGGRVNYVSNHYEGYLRNISANLGGGTTMTQLSPYFTTMSTNFTNLATQAAAAGDATLAARYTAIATQAGGIAKKTADRALDVDQSGWGFTPIIGVNYKWNRLQLAAKYEFKTSLNIQNQTKVNTTGVASFEDGVNTPHDIPAMLSLGAAYEALDGLRFSAGYHHYFDKSAGMSGDRNKAIKHGTHEYLAGVEYDVTPRITVSAGGQITNYGLSDGYQQDLSFSCDSYSVGMGAAFKLSERVKFNVAYFFTDYKDYTKAQTSYAGTGVAGSDVYSRTNHVIGAGLDIAF